MDKVKIRQAKLTDFDILVPQILIFEELHAVYDDGHLTIQAREDAKENLKRNIKKKYFWVAEMDGKVIGFIKALISEYHTNRLMIDNLFVEEGYRKQGIGSKLMSYVEELFKKDKGVNQVVLWVAKQNVNAENLYISRGFKFKEDIWKEYIKEL